MSTATSEDEEVESKDSRRDRFGRNSILIRRGEVRGDHPN